MKYIKWIFPVLFLAAIGFSVSGCGSAETDSSNDTTVIESTVENEGSDDSPVLLSLNQSHDGKVGWNLEDYQSFYRIYIDTAGSYTISVSALSESVDLDIFLFDSAAFSSPIDDSSANSSTSGDSLIYTFSSAGYYYIGIENMDYKNTTFDLLVTKNVQYDGEGSIASPVGLTLDANHDAVVGTDLDSYGYSYYTFTSGDAGEYTITYGNASPYADLTAYLYSDAAFSGNYEIDASSPMVKVLEGSTTYYLKIKNSTNTAQVNFDLNVSRTADLTYEGTSAAPVVLTLGETHDGKVGSSYDNADYSYYQFTTTYAGWYVVSALNLSPSLSVDYLNIDISNDPSFYSLSNFTFDRTMYNLDANLTYYIRVNNSGVFDTSYGITVGGPDALYTITETENNASDPMILSVGTQYEAHVSTSSLDGNSSYYQFTTGPNSGYKMINFLNPSPTADLDAYLYDNNETLIKSSAYTDTGAILGATLDGNTTYKLKIINYTDTSDVTYDLWIYASPE